MYIFGVLQTILIPYFVYRTYNISAKSQLLQGLDESTIYFNFVVYVCVDFIHNLCYNYSMENNYRHTNTTVSLINYHFVFCPRYRRKIFLIPNVEQRFKELVEMKCKELKIEIIAIECDKDHSHMFLNCLPTLSPSDIMQQIKGYTSKILREEFKELSKMPSLWTRSYFVSTAGNVCSETIKKYVENQKKRY